jgi:hypothetical protein
MSTLHTPGPWDHSNGKVFGSTCTAILTVHKQKSQTVSLANLALVSAAPELLEALQLVLAEFCKDGHGGDFEDGEHPYVDKARAAIAKATEAA